MFASKHSSSLADDCEAAIFNASVTKAESFVLEVCKKQLDKVAALKEMLGILKIMALPTEKVSRADLHPLLRTYVEDTLKMR